MNEQPFQDAEVWQIARRLVMTKGDGALEYAANMAQVSEESSDDSGRVFWETIARRVEGLLNGS